MEQSSKVAFTILAVVAMFVGGSVYGCHLTTTRDRAVAALCFENGGNWSRQWFSTTPTCNMEEPRP